MSFQSYPNPVNPATTIRYELPTPVKMSLVIYNLLGEKVTTLVNEEKTPGCHVVTWDDRNHPGTRVTSVLNF